MNIIDIVILVVLGISALYGIYRGFMHTILSLACCLVSVILAFSFSPKLAQWIRNNPGISSTLATYTDAGARVGDSDLANTSVQELPDYMLQQILDNVTLPQPIAEILQNNLTNRVLENTNENTVNDYVSKTIVTVVIDILSFIACFIVAYLVLSLLINLIHHVFKLPLLKQLDWLAGGIFGLLRGAMTLYVIFLLIPIISTVIPLDSFNVLLSESSLAPIFQSDGFFAKAIAGQL